jgi:K+-transporting ATPase KdpF subunit
MSMEYVIGIVVTAGLCVYLLYALVAAEKL